MTKTELIKAIAGKANLTNAQATAAYNAFVASVTEALKNGEKVQLVGFGSFEIKDVPAKTGLNPATKEQISIPACKKPVLKFGKSYKDTFNK